MAKKRMMSGKNEFESMGDLSRLTGALNNKSSLTSQSNVSEKSPSNKPEWKVGLLGLGAIGLLGVSGIVISNLESNGSTEIPKVEQKVTKQDTIQKSTRIRISPSEESSDIKNLKKEIKTLEKTLITTHDALTKEKAKVGSLSLSKGYLTQTNKEFQTLYEQLTNGELFILKDLDLDFNGVIDEIEKLVIYDSKRDNFYGKNSLLEIGKGTAIPLQSGINFTNHITTLFRNHDAQIIESNVGSVKYYFSLKYTNKFLGTEQEKIFDKNSQRKFRNPN